MCGIYGAFGNPSPLLVEALRRATQDRGRDGGRIERYELAGGRVAYLGNWRATPTPEVERGRLQPYDGVVHNGTIANAEKLGLGEGEVDSEILPLILRRGNVEELAQSLDLVEGSYALAVVGRETVYLARNWKPLYFWSPDGETFYFASMARHFANVCPRGQAPVMLPAYTALDLGAGVYAGLPRQHGNGIVVVASSGLDSTVAAAYAVRQSTRVLLLHFRYGCHAETREARRCREIAATLGADYAELSLPYGDIGASPLLEEGAEIAGPIEGAEQAHEWVPARNLVFLSMAVALAEARGYARVWYGGNLEEAGGYPDNEEEFVYHLDRSLDLAVERQEVRLEAPLGGLMKHEIVRMGLGLGAPLGLTWSCYRGEEKHCGGCGPCFMRRVAFERCGAEDPVFVNP